ncbi:MAG TPA: SGNH/GDSL hydrolase family protein [Nocardioidaceae bacterium]|nr:SGNH/GDSL hydrolase family protein [Nocardioidaceae bacterium]
MAAAPLSRHARTIAVAGVGGALVSAVLAKQVVRMQARIARRVIGKPLGEEALAADRVYKKRYGNPVDLLLLGDSIAAGLGAETPKHTLGAQLAKRVAKRTERAVRLHTAAIVGSETSMLRAQLAGLPAGYVADVAVIVVGGNDVTHRVRTTASKRQLAEAVESLQQQGTAVVVGTCPDLGALSAVPQPLRTLAGLASRQLAAAQRDVATDLGARAVSLAEVVGPFFVAQPDEMFAIDRFHPSGAGYRRTAKALLPSVLGALGHDDDLPFGHHAPAALRSVTR